MKLLASVLLGVSYGQLWKWGNRGARPSPGGDDGTKTVVDKPITADSSLDDLNFDMAKDVNDEQDFDKTNDADKHPSSPIPDDFEDVQSGKYSPMTDDDEEFNQFYDKFVNHLHGFISDKHDEHKEETEEREVDRHEGKHEEPVMSEMKKDCNDCNQNINNNYAPVNTNIQNFVDIETNVNTNYNFNMGNTISKPDKNWWPKKDWDKEWDFPMEEEWEKDPEHCIKEVKEFIEAEFGFKVTDEMLSMIGDKDQFKNMVLNFFKLLQQDDEEIHDDQNGQQIEDEIDAEECMVNDKGCEEWSTCRNVNGMATCVCDHGLDLDGKTCINHQGSGDQVVDQPTA